MKNNRRNIVILFGTLVIVMLGFGMIIPILPFYIDAFGASGSELGLLMAIFAVMQFLFAPIWGQLSDRYGRKPILMVGVLGNAFSMLFFGLSTELWMLYASRALAGILSSATLPTAMAYIGDSTSEENRGGGMGLMGAAMGVGMILGPGIGGWLADYALSTPFFVAAGLSTLMLPFILLVLPESLPKEERDRQEGGLSGPQFKEMWQALFSPIGFLFILAFLVSFGLTNFEAVFGLYAKDRFDYDAKQVGTIMAVIGLISVVAQGGLIGPLSKRWGEAAIIRGSLLASAIGFVVMLQARTYATVLLTVGFFIVSNAMLRPAVSSLISRRTPSGQGVAMGLNNSFMSLGRIIGPMWAGFVYDVNLTYPYYSGALIMLVGFLMSLVWLKAESPEAVVQPRPAGEPESLKH
ncbi:MAG TPA: MFS transporter [Anaerolineae bacterium]|nr:MFS transporter [Anaerolineae bacterium]